MKKTLVLILCTIMIVSMVACGDAGKATPESGGKTNTEATPPAGTGSEKPVELTFLCQINVDTEGYDVNDNPYINYLREELNLDINIISESSNYANKVNTVMASGDYPDYVQLPKSLYFKYAQDGALLKLDELINETDYPNLMAGIDEQYWNFSRVDGGIYGVPFVRYDTTPYISYARKDWLDNLGIDPTTLKTVDDYYNMLYAFTHNDPDQNGQNDTYGLSSNTGGSAMNSVAERYIGMLFIDAFDAAQFKVIDGKVIPNYITDGYKDYLKFLAKLYADGIIVPDYITKTQKQTEEEFMNGKFGVLNLFWSLSSLNSMRENLYPLAPPQKVNGGGQSKYIYATPVRHWIGITSACKHPEKILQMYDWAETDAGSEFIHAGVEGWDFDRVNGELVIREDRVGINWAWRFITLGHQKSKVDSQLLPILTQSWGELAMEQLKLSEQYGANDPLYVSAPEFSELSDYDFDTYVASYRDEVIMGRKDVDSTWDSFVSGWYQFGGDHWVELYTDWYNTSYNK
jgi:putative aldouronate transport system substrate-binding protein